MRSSTKIKRIISGMMVAILLAGNSASVAASHTFEAETVKKSGVAETLATDDFNAAETQVSSEMVKATETSVAVKMTESTGMLNVTDGPESTGTPTATDGPESTETPTATDDPEVTGTPTATDSPEATKSPSSTTTPQSQNILNSRVLNLRTISRTGTELVIGWDKVTGADGYQIWEFNKKTNGYDVYDETDKCEYKLSNVTSGKSMTFLIRAFVEEKGTKVYGGFSDKHETATVPDDVTELQAVSSSSALVVLSWKPVSEDASYLVYRCAEGKTEFSQIANITGCVYNDSSVKAGTGYTYKVVAYVGDVSIKSLHETLVMIATCPKATSITSHKGGDGKARLKWKKVKASDGYIVYMCDSTGVYNEIVRFNDIATLEYVKEGLVNGANYSFMVKTYKIFNGIEYTSDMSNIVGVTPLYVKPTVVKAALYNNYSKVKKSRTYRTYKDFAKALVLKKSIVVPGIKHTNINGFGTETMVIQAIVDAGNYMLVSAYDSKGEENSVIYVINRKTRKFVTLLVLPGKSHVGGMAYDGSNIWLSNNKKVSAFKFAKVKEAVSSGQSSYNISFLTECSIATKSSFITYNDGYLWIGEHIETKNGKMCGYKIKNKKKTPLLTNTYSMTVPSRTQDVLFMKDGSIIFSRSNQISKAVSKYYISGLYKYKPTWKKKQNGKKVKIKSGTIKLGKRVGYINMPSMMEGISFKNKHLYVSFESASKVVSSCPYKMDRICALKLSKIKWKK